VGACCRGIRTPTVQYTETITMGEPIVPTPRLGRLCRKTTLGIVVILVISIHALWNDKKSTWLQTWMLETTSIEKTQLLVVTKSIAASANENLDDKSNQLSQGNGTKEHQSDQNSPTTGFRTAQEINTNVQQPPKNTQTEEMRETQFSSTTKTKSSAASSSSSTLLSLPFYVYESLIWENATYGPDQTLAQFLQEYPYRHSDDFWFLKAALKHPMRTFDPSQAKLFVVPTVMNSVTDAIYESKRYKGRKEFPVCVQYYQTTNHPKCDQKEMGALSNNNIGIPTIHEENTATATATTDNNSNNNNCTKILCNEELVQYAEQVLGNSPYFQRSNGRDHIMVLSNWFGTSSLCNRTRGSPIFSKMNMIGFEDVVWNPNRITFPSTYVGNPCPPTTTTGKQTTDHEDEPQPTVVEKTHDFVMVATLHKGNQRKKVNFNPRQNICKWLSKLKQQQHKDYNFSTSICGEGQQCPALAQTRYGFHVRGDTWGSNRLMDTILSSTVPIFTSPEQYKILPDWIDWKVLSVEVNLTSKDEFQKGLDPIIKDMDGSLYQEKLQHVVSNRDLLDWRSGIPFDAYMYMFQRKLFPKSVDPETHPGNPYAFSALKIPTGG